MNKIIYHIRRFLRSAKYNYRTNPQVLFKDLSESQFWSREKIVHFQLNQLNKLLLASLNSSIYYKKILNDSDLPIKEIGEFNVKIPFITKEIIKKEFEYLKTEHFYIKFKHSTSGSTGDPLTIYTSGLAESYRDAGFMRFLDWWDVKPYDKRVLIWGRKASKSNNLIEKLKKSFHLSYDINVFDLNSNTILNYYNDIKNFKPAYIRGYKSAILQFAELLEENNLYFNNFKLKVAIVTSEVLLEGERLYIEKILNCRVANEYGTAEAGLIAHECTNGSMHIFEEAVYLSTNKSNEVFITELHNDSMPLINYKNNDRVIISEDKCVCGRSSRIISEINGRDDDILLKPNGERINQNLFVYIIMELDDIGLDRCIIKWKVVQNKNKFQILIVPTNRYTEKVEKYIKKRFYEEIGDDIFVEFNLVESIPRDKSGKLRLFSRIS